MASVFISYRQDSDARCALVRRLAEQLELSGLDVVLDQFAQDRQFRGGGPDGGWPLWSATQAGASAHRVLVVASASWFRCYAGTEHSGVGLGATAEAAVVRQRLYNAGNAKDVRIIVFDHADVTGIPLELAGYHRFVLPGDINDLIRWLGGTVGPEMGERGQWPDRAPALSWPMADHSAVRDAFAQLITREAAVRYLSIQGPSETGKSHITKELLVNAMHIDGLACGRFDFKGMSDVESELSLLVDNLDVPIPPPASTLNQRLSGVLTSLRQRGRPALMIFDTFEQAGEAASWVDQLLVDLIRAPYLRIVIAGQRVPERGRRTIRLTLPAPEDWHEYGRLHKPEIDLEFVRTAHECCRGKASVLAQLLGPGA
jgi:hypothetical protein